jgi:hypothetical protein
MLETWIKCQRVGLAAYRLNKPVRFAYGADVDEEASIKDLRAFLEAELTSLENSQTILLENPQTALTPLALEFLLNLPKDRLGATLKDMRPAWQAALESHVREGKGGSVPLSYAGKIIAHHTLHGATRALPLFRLARRLFGKRSTSYYNRWRDLERDESVLEAASSTLKILRSPWMSTAKKVEATEALSKLLSLSNKNLFWEQVEYSIYQQLMCWPLLIRAGKGAYSLPIGIDVDLDKRDQITTIGVDSLILSPEWRQSLQTVVGAARVLWLGKHGNAGSFREEVEKASIVFDLQLASRIVDGFPERFSLEDRSMEAYFCQVILSRFLGQPVFSTSIVSGSIGPRRQEHSKKLMDFKFEWPRGLSRKLNYVFKTRSFERVILPDLKGLSYNDPRRIELRDFVRHNKHYQSTELNFVTHLQHVADTFQVNGWRQFRYVRCPDVAWSIHPSGKRLPSAENAGIQECLEILRNNRQPVLELSGQVTPRALAGALWHINVVLRDRIRLQDRPPMLSWAFVRTTPEEQDTKFWHVVWGVTGATAEEFDSFHRTAKAGDAATLLARAFNSFDPSYIRPGHRSPDVTVILGAGNLYSSMDQAPTPALRQHSLEFIVERLRDHSLLMPNPNPQVRNLIGDTRLIMFATDVFEEPSEKEPQPETDFVRELIEGLSELRLEKIEHDLLNSLSVFRFGFTQQMVSVLWWTLGHGDMPVRSLLEKFNAQGYLRYFAGEYYFPGRVGRQCEHAGDPLEDAKTHYAAGIALAPYAATTEMPGLALDRSLKPEYVHEANYHLRLALKLSRADRRLSGVVGGALSNVMRFAEYPGWAKVRGLMNGNSYKDAFEYAVELLEQRNDEEGATHPVHLLTAAAAADRWWNHIRKDKNFKDVNYVTSLLLKSVELFEEARRACEHPDFLPEADYNRFRYLTQYSLFIRKSNDALREHGIEYQDPIELTSQALELLNSGVDSRYVLGEWYEYAGDLLQDHKAAEKVYEVGIKHGSRQGQLHIKYLGCGCLNYIDEGYAGPKTAEDRAGNLTKEEILKALDSCLKALRRNGDPPPPWVKARWASCINLLRQLYKGDESIQESIKQFDNVISGWANGV